MRARTMPYGYPSVPRMLGRGLTRACPVCSQRGLFRRLKMLEDCPKCGLHFERIEGHWIGAIGINTMVSFAVLAITLFLGLWLTYPEFNTLPLAGSFITVAVLFPYLFFGSSRMFWMAMDIGMRALGPHEIDWSVLDERNKPHLGVPEGSDLTTEEVMALNPEDTRVSA